MIDGISGTNFYRTGLNTKTEGQEESYDLHHISPNELDALTLKMFRKGEISLKERLPFVPLDMTGLSQSLGKDVHVRYYSRVWEDPDRKRDMLSEFRSILQDQIKDNDTQMSIDFTKGALSLLEKLESGQSFGSILKKNLSNSG